MPEIKIYECVECSICKKLHRKEDLDFLIFEGNFRKGVAGYKRDGIFVICDSMECFQSLSQLCSTPNETEETTGAENPWDIKMDKNGTWRDEE